MTPQLSAAVPTPADVARIAAMQDAVVRNANITQCYHELACALARRLPGHANWCTFATWASKQAGQTIRGEDVESTLRRHVGDSPAVSALLDRVVAGLRALGAKQGVAELRRIVIDATDPAGAARRAADAVARGNLKVFAEIGREFAAFLADCCDDTSADAAPLSALLAALRDGDPPDGQRWLRQAFARYHAALRETEPRVRAELLLLANLEVGFHEQTRLQQEIRAALDAAVVDPDEVVARLIGRVFPTRAALMIRAKRFARRLFGGATPLDTALQALADVLRRELRAVITAHLMTLALPGRVLRLGRDLDRAFPPSLERLQNAELIALLARVDPTPDSVSRSGAVDWGDFADRMHFIADLFRCWHEAPELFEPPFSESQVAALRAGRRPDGRL